MGSFYLDKDNQLSRALADNDFDSYLNRASSNEVQTDLLNLLEFNVKVGKDRPDREELALQFIHSAGAVVATNEYEEVLSNAYKMADLVIEQRQTKGF